MLLPFTRLDPAGIVKQDGANSRSQFLQSHFERLDRDGLADRGGKHDAAGKLLYGMQATFPVLLEKQQALA